MADTEISKLMWISIVVALAASIFVIARPQIKTLATSTFDKISAITDGIGKSDIKHTAYANSADGITDFTTTKPNLNLLDGTSSILKTASAKDWGTPDSLTTNTIDFKKGESYTYSAWIQDCDIDTRAVIYLFGSSSGFVAHLGNTIPAGSSGLSTVTFNISDDIDSYKTSIGFMESQASYHNLSYSRLKLEDGSTATQYTPSASEVKPSDQPKYIGTYMDHSETASQTPSQYKWVPNPDYKA